MSAGQKPLGQLLKEMELVTEGQVQEALEIQRQKGGAIGDVLVSLGYVNKDELLLALGAQMGMEVVPIEEMEIPPEIIDMVPASMAKAVMEQIISTGTVTRGWLGVELVPIAPTAPESPKQNQPEGVVIGRVVPGGPSDTA